MKGSDPAHPDPFDGLETSQLLIPEGPPLIVRSVRPSDKGLIAAGVRQMSPESRYMRFFAHVNELEDADLEYLTELDHRDHEALIAIDPETGAAIGVARYVRLLEPELAELAVAVGDPWQGRGIATALLSRLSDVARREGITHFVARMLPGNERAMGLLHEAKTLELRDLADGKIEALIELPPPTEAGLGEGLSTMLRAAAQELLHISPRRVLRGLLSRRTASDQGQIGPPEP